MIDSETSNRNPASTVDVAQIGKRIGMIRGRGMDEAQRRHKGDENDGGKKRRKIEEGFRGGEGHLWNSAIPLLLHQRRLENSFAESRSAGSGCYGTTSRRQLKGTADV